MSNFATMVGLRKISMKKIYKKCEICGGKFHGTFRNSKEPMKLCCKHLHHMTRFGYIKERTKRDKNEIIKCGVTSKILLYDKDCNIIGETLIDTKFVESVMKYKWVGVKKGKSLYVKTEKPYKRGEKRKTIYLSSLIIKCKKGFQIDHISGDSLDNRLENLRCVTQQQNLMNKPSALGMSKTKNGLWHTYIGVNGKRIQLGWFKNKKEALKVRRDAELKYFGEFAPKRELLSQFKTNN